MKLIKLSALIITLVPYSVPGYQLPHESTLPSDSSQQEKLAQYARHPIKRDDMDREAFAQLILQEKLRREKEHEIKKDAAALVATIK